MTGDDLQAWVGRTTVTTDSLAPAPMRGLAALFDRPAEVAPGALVPPLGHWLYFLPDASQATLGADGHPLLGRDMPDAGLPRRMWAGSRVTFHTPLRIGAEARRETVIASLKARAGRSGRLLFVTLRHTISVEGETAVIEDQDIVYRAPPAPGSSSPPAAQPLTPSGRLLYEQAFDPVRLFRFSALTFNGHRIHYDRPYATEVEGYAGLVVHGPYLAMTMLASACEAGGRVPAEFGFRALQPAFDGEPIAFHMAEGEDGATLSAHTTRGEAMEGQVIWRRSS